ncbi:MAG TPA: sulfurtransferase complex subunit TusB [Pseudomonadales bacterium]|nr:sulfurtransferase complex subunit TusB [Pseudomonadales bacterium]
MILHTVNKSPFTTRALAECLRFIVPGDSILLLEDGVYAASKSGPTALIDVDTPVYAIKADVDARGLSRHLVDTVQVVDYDGFVRLCTDHDVIKNWS